MSTRSRIGLEHPDGSITSIYCHFDGYLDSVGKTLEEHYTDLEKVKQLMALGDLSSLGEDIGTEHNFDNHYNGPRNECNAYGRDRKETNIEAKEHKTIQEFVEHGEEYNYLFKYSDGTYGGQKEVGYHWYLVDDAGEKYEFWDVPGDFCRVSRALETLETNFRDI